jgi:Ca2+-binding RTX toxin-like protein
LSGESLPETICGNAGNDVIEGNGGADKLFGDPDRDRLRGGRGGDRLYGGANYGGIGKDRLSGGPGDDKLFAKGDGARDCVWGGTGDNDWGRLSLGSNSWNDNHDPAPWGGNPCGDTASIETLD